MKSASNPLRKTVLLMLAALLAVGLALAWIAGSLMVQVRQGPVPPARPPAEDLRLTTSDGVSLAATYRSGASPTAPGVLLLHGVGASRAATAANAEWLSREGYATLTIDFRGHGESAPSPTSLGLNEARDAHAGFDWLKRRQDGAPVAVIGISMGGAASLLDAAGPLPADALVLQAVYPDIRHAVRNRIARRLAAAPAYLLEPFLSFQSLPRFGVWPSALSPIRAIRRFEGPVLVIGGLQDRYTPPGETRALYAAAPGPKRLWLVGEGDHAAVSDLRDGAYRERIAAFLRATIGRPAPQPS